MSDNDLRWECECCGWRGLGSDLLKAPNPFGGTDEVIGCPNCKTIGEFTNACDVCWKPATCGGMTDLGYKRMCGEHFRELSK